MEAVRGVVRLRQRAVSAVFLCIVGGSFAAYADAPTYYVSTSGSDLNNGLTPETPWATVSKVDAASALFTPGTDVLFQRGDVWTDGELIPLSSGSATAPITYSAYGNASAPKPEFLGSDVVSGFSSLGNGAYTVSTPSVLGAVYLNHDFLHPASVLAGTTDPVQYVLNNANTYYYDNSASQLYVNTGNVSANSATITATRRQGLVDSNNQSYLVFDNLQTDETAVPGNGIAFDIVGGSNVTVQNSDAFRAGKHHFQAINTTNFIGKNLTAEYSMPDQQSSGGSSAYVSYGDAGGPAHQTSEWDNISASNLGDGNSFITHGPAISKVTINNLNAPGAPIGLSSDVQNGAVTLNGGTTGDIFVAAPGTVIDGTTVLNGTIYLQGPNAMVQNVLMHGLVPNAGYRGDIVISGLDNTIRYSTLTTEPGGRGDAADIVIIVGAGTTIYGNIFSGPSNFLNVLDTTLSVYSNHNLFSSDPTIEQGFSPAFNLTQWQAMGYDDSSVFADPQFTDAANGDYSLLATSPAVGPFFGAFWQLLTHDAFGNARPSGNTIDMGAIERTTPVTGTYTAEADSDLGDPGVAVQLDGDTLLINGDVFSSTNRPVVIGINGGTINIASATNTFHVANLQVAGPLAKDGAGRLVLSGNYTNSAVTLISGGTLELAGATNSASEFFGSGTLQVDAGSTLVSSGIAIGTLRIYGSVRIQLNSTFDGTCVVNSLVLQGGTDNWTTGIDITNNHLIIEDTSTHDQTLTRIKNQAAYGQTHAAGIYSSVEVPGHIMVVVDNAYFGKTFYDGTDLDGGSIIVFSTFMGDANLDGMVDIQDLQILATHWQQGVGDWSVGDFDGNGVVDIRDLQVIASHWQNGVNSGSGGAGTGSDVANLSGQFEALIGGASVPEPLSLGLLLPGIGMLLARRRCK